MVPTSSFLIYPGIIEGASQGNVCFGIQQHSGRICRSLIKAIRPVGSFEKLGKGWRSSLWTLFLFCVQIFNWTWMNIKINFVFSDFPHTFLVFVLEQSIFYKFSINPILGLRSCSTKEYLELSGEAEWTVVFRTHHQGLKPWGSNQWDKFKRKAKKEMVDDIKLWTGRSLAECTVKARERGDSGEHWCMNPWPPTLGL